MAETKDTIYTPEQRTLSERILDAHRSRARDAAQDHSARMATADLERLGIGADTVRRFTEGVEPTWLIRAKKLHGELGTYIHVLSQRSSMDLPPDVFAEAEHHVRTFVSNMPGQADHERLDVLAFLVIVAGVSEGHEVFRDAPSDQSPAEVVCFAYSLHDIDVAIKLAEHITDVELLLRRWPDRTPRRPTRWRVAADLWRKATGKALAPSTMSRYDPKKKQVLPGSRGQKPARSTRR